MPPSRPWSPARSAVAAIENLLVGHPALATPLETVLGATNPVFCSPAHREAGYASEVPSYAPVVAVLLVVALVLFATAAVLQRRKRAGGVIAARTRKRRRRG
jgi:hypothetical protein